MRSVTRAPLASSASEIAPSPGVGITPEPAYPDLSDTRSARPTTEKSFDRLHIPKDYFEAREEFRSLATETGARLSRLPIQARGPGGEELTVDIARIGPADAKAVVADWSGVHGVEGYVGHMIHRAILKGIISGEVKLPPGVAIDLVSSANPYGFAWNRRVNEDTADLARNLSASPDLFKNSNWRYKWVMSPFLNPKRNLFGKVGLEVGFVVQFALAGFSMKRLQHSLMKGQYTKAGGLFFGGFKRAESLEVITKHFKTAWKEAKKVINFERHSGIGEYAKSELMFGSLSHPELTKKVLAALPQYKSRALPTTGSVANGMVELFPHLEVVGALQETGTLPKKVMFAKMREETRLHSSGSRDPNHAGRIDFKESFMPNDPAWAEQAITDGMIMFKKLLEVAAKA